VFFFFTNEGGMYTGHALIEGDVWGSK